MTVKKRVLTQAFGVVHIVFGVTGLVLLAVGLGSVLPRLAVVAHFPYELLVYKWMLVMNGIFSAGLVLAGYWLLRLWRKGVTLSNYIFSFELLYFLAVGLFCAFTFESGNFMILSLGRSIGAVAGVGNMPLGFQILSAYPVVGLVFLNVGSRNLNTTGYSNAAVREGEPRKQQDVMPGGKTRRTLRVVGITNVILGSIGLAQLLLNVVGYLLLPASFIDQYAPFVRHGFLSMSIATVLLLPALVYAGIRLLLAGHRAITFCAIVFAAEAVYLLTLLLTWNLGLSPLLPPVVFSGLFNLGLAIQLVTAYPIVGLFLLYQSRQPTVN